ncbi:MAG: hypothetical protein AB1646_25970 [Thermodesulfobacteriota bacterium]
MSALIPFMRGMILPLEGGGQAIIFEWNPKQIEGPGAKAEYAQIKTAGRETPFLQYSNGDVISIRFDLELSRSDFGDGYVKGVVDNLVRLTKPTVRGQGVNRPPRVKFLFGNLLRRTCIVAEVNPVFKGQFNPLTLEPYGASVSVLLWEYKG